MSTTYGTTTAYWHHGKMILGHAVTCEMNAEAHIRRDHDPGMWRDRNGDGCPPSDDYNVLIVHAIEVYVWVDNGGYAFVLTHPQDVEAFVAAWNEGLPAEARFDPWDAESYLLDEIA